jgi:transcriptional regulator with XRE-family HTH domain
MEQSSELAAFLRARRERVRPEDVGLPSNGRRRTPGLRREELATIAGISIDYLVRLEQGRDTNPSAAVVASLAEALRLSEDERQHLAHLVARTSMRELCPTAVALPDGVRPTIRTLLDNLSPTPAFVVDPLKHVLAWNDAWDTLARPLGMLDEDPPNLITYTFEHPLARASFPDWERLADDHASQLRAARGRWCDSTRFKALVARLSGVPEFASRWETHLVAEAHAGTKRVAHPEVGELRVAFEALALADDGQLLITWLPADESTEKRFRVALHAPSPVSPARLRVVADA